MVSSLRVYYSMSSVSANLDTHCLGIPSSGVAFDETVGIGEWYGALPFQPVHLLRAEGPSRCSHISPELIHGPCAQYGSCHTRLLQKPVQRNLCWCLMPFFSYSKQSFDDAPGELTLTLFGLVVPPVFTTDPAIARRCLVLPILP